MKTISTRILTFFGIALLAAAMVFFFSCEQETKSDDPEIPSELQETEWFHKSGDKISFDKDSVTITPSGGSSQKFTLKDTSSIDQSGIKQTILFFKDNKTQDDSITYCNGSITMVNFSIINDSNRANNWSDNSSNVNNNNNGNDQFPAAQGKLSINGLSSFNNKYVYVMGLAGSNALFGLTDITGFPSEITHQLAKISGGEVKVPLYYVNASATSYSDSFIAYSGNDPLSSAGYLSVIILNESSIKSSNVSNAIKNHLSMKHISSGSFSNGNMTVNWETIDENNSNNNDDDDDNNTPLDPHLEYKVEISSVTITGYTGSGGDVIIPKKIDNKPVTVIEQYAFFFKNITSVIIPDSVTKIGSSAFQDNQLTSIVIPNSVTNIERQAFYRNKLTSATIPNSITTISKESFAINQLTSVTIPDSVTLIDEKAFYDNQLTSVFIPNSVVSIKEDAFYFNIHLTSVVFSNSVYSISSKAFMGTNLTSITIGENVFLQPETFVDCKVNQDGKATFYYNDFSIFYDENNNAAGTYTRPNTNTKTWTYTN